jgi:hypothetical protein
MKSTLWSKVVKEGMGVHRSFVIEVLLLEVQMVEMVAKVGM